MKIHKTFLASILFTSMLSSHAAGTDNNIVDLMQGSWMAPALGTVDDLIEYNALKDLYEATAGLNWVKKNELVDTSHG